MSIADRIPAEQPEIGWTAHEVAAEFPELKLLAVEVDCPPVLSTQQLQQQLRSMSDRWSGQRAVALRREPIPAAYRIFFRHIGLDPDITRTPIEQAIFERLLNGGFLPSGKLDDVLLLALVETGVPVWALDADTVEGPLGIRVSARERLGCAADAVELSAGQLVIADARSALAVLFGTIGSGHEPHQRTRRLVLFTVQVAGVSTMHAEEALWLCTSALRRP